MTTLTLIVQEYHAWLLKKQREHRLTEEQLWTLVDRHLPLQTALVHWWDMAETTDEKTARTLARTLCQAWVVAFKASTEAHPLPIPQKPAAFFQMHSTLLDDVLTVFPTSHTAQDAWDATTMQATYSAAEIPIFQAMQMIPEGITPEKLQMIHRVKGIFGATLQPLEDVPPALPPAKDNAYETGDAIDSDDTE